MALITGATAIYLGLDEATKVYHGGQLVWEPPSVNPVEAFTDAAEVIEEHSYNGMTGTLYKWLGNGSITFNTDATVYHLVVAGGGSGGAQTRTQGGGAGGGGGGVVGSNGSSFNAAAGVYSINVGLGGAAKPENNVGEAGGNSSIVGPNAPEEAIGGGGGARRFSVVTGGDGGSGGGAGSSGNPGSGVAGQGFAGAPLHASGMGGGGGASEAGIPYTVTASGPNITGKGGEGRTVNISGDPVVYGSGGGGGARFETGDGLQPAPAATNGGRGGFMNSASGPAEGLPGVDGTGGGGGGNGTGGAAGDISGKGGNGVVFLFVPPVTPSRPEIEYLGGLTQDMTPQGSVLDLTPLGLQAGDLVVLAFGAGTRAARSNAGLSGDPSWIEQFYFKEDINSNLDSTLFVYTKRMGSVPDTSVVVGPSSSANDGQAIIATAWRNVNVAPMDVVPTFVSGVATILPETPSIAPTTEKAVILSIITHTTVSGTMTPEFPTVPPDLTNGLNVIGASSDTHARMGMGHKPATNGLNLVGGWDISLHNGNNQSFIATTIALRPAS